MSDFRIRYGHAVGPEGTYTMTSGLNIFAQSDTTPDVSDGVLFYSNNSTATTITYFDVLGRGGINGNSAHQGKRIVVFFRDANTTIQNGGQIFLEQTQGAIAANTIMEFLLHNSAWYETNRSVNTQTPQSPGGAVRAVSYTFSGTIGGAMLNVTTADRIYITASAVANITGFAGGVSNQAIDLTVIGIGTNVFVTQSAGVLTLPGTTTALLSNSGTYRFLTYNGVEWYLEGGFAA